jgi:integrase
LWCSIQYLKNTNKMAEYNFYLKEPKTTGETPIYLFIRFKDGTKLQTIKLSIGEKIEPKYWNPDLQTPRKTFEGHLELKTRLEDYKTRANEYFRRLQNDNMGQLPQVEELKEVLIKEFRDIITTPSKPQLDFFNFVDAFIIERKDGINPSTGKKFSDSLTKHYSVTLNKIKEFNKKKRIKKFDFDSVTLDFYFDFMEYLKKQNYSANYIGCQIKVLKTFMSSARERGLHNNTDYTKKRFQKTSEVTDQIYLSVEELEQLETLDLSKDKRLENVRDLLILGAWTGLRFSDFNEISTNDIKLNSPDGDIIIIRTQKTGRTVVIPIFPQVRRIIDRYKDRTANSLPRPITNQKFNEYIKEVGKLAEIDEPVSLSITKGGVRIAKTTPKYEVMSSHVCRRSFATNAYKMGVPSITIREITGHDSESAFLRYIRATPKEHANKMRDIMMQQMTPYMKIA